MAYPQDNRENLVVTIGTPQTITADLNSADNLEVDLSKKKLHPETQSSLLISSFSKSLNLVPWLIFLFLLVNSL